MKEFNITSLCIQEKHYTADITNKVGEAVALIKKGKYFTINQARQYGKTTIIHQIYLSLKKEYLVIEISFEGLGSDDFSSESRFCRCFIHLIGKKLRFNGVSEPVVHKWLKMTEDAGYEADSIVGISEKITELVNSINKEVVLMIDEVDKISNHETFINFLGMLRLKYIEREKSMDQTFKSVVLAGVYDVKNLKLKLLPHEDKKYSSPWNIAANYTADLSFNPEEIAVMIKEYETDWQTGMDIIEISRLLFDYTSGYPFLVSRLGMIIHEDCQRDWTTDGIENAAGILLMESNTLFDDLFKNLENNPLLYELIFDVLFNNVRVMFTLDNPAINKASMYAIIRNEKGMIRIHNKIFEIRIYNYFISKLQTDRWLPIIKSSILSN